MNKFVLKRGISDVYVAEVTKDDNELEGGYKVGTPYQLIPVGEMSTSPDSESTQVYFDNAVFATVGREGKSEISITGAGLRPADVAAINGKDVDETTGAVFDSGDYVEKYYALGGKKKNLDGTYEYFWFLKGTFAVPEENDKTEDDSTDTNGTTLTYSAVPTVHKFTKTSKHCKRVVLDDSDERSATIDFSKWFEDVVTPDTLPTKV